ncbi:MAG: hypothetical protein JXQ30_14925 [Spirochaetes bacterium]|nr:hypothetical protein [Spirochaetota bacterium]
MKNRKYIIISLIAISIVTALLIVSCAGGGGEEGGITAAFVFKDEASGEPISGIPIILNGETKTTDASGRVSVSTESGSMLLEGCIDGESLLALGYAPFGVTAFFFRFTVTGSFTHTMFLWPDSEPDYFYISGDVVDKEGGAFGSGEISIYSADGRRVGQGSVGDSYNGYVCDYPNNRGNLYFIVSKDDVDTYYTVKNVTGEGVYDLSYDGTDITLSGDAGDADWGYALLQLGEELYTIGWFSPVESAYSVTVPHRGTDAIRLIIYKQDIQENDFTHLAAETFTETASADLAFASGSTVDPSVWNHELSWNEGTRTLTWNEAGNATCYEIEFLTAAYEILAQGFLEGNSFTVPSYIDLTGLDHISIIPTWSQVNQAEVFMRTSTRAAVGTSIYYLNLKYTIYIGPV